MASPLSRGIWDPGPVHPASALGVRCGGRVGQRSTDAGAAAAEQALALFRDLGDRTMSLALPKGLPSEAADDGTVDVRPPGYLPDPEALSARRTAPGDPI